MKARDILNSPEKWAQGYYAFDAQGKRVSPTAPEAVRFCILGAIQRAYGGLNDESQRIGYKVVRALILKGWAYGAGTWNDHEDRKFKHVRGLLEELDI